MWKSRSPGVDGAVCVFPLTSLNGLNSDGRGRQVIASQTEDPMPTVQANEAFRSRIETFLARPLIPERTDRIVLIESGVWIAERTRKVAEQVRGASTCCDSIGTRRDIALFEIVGGNRRFSTCAIE